LRNIETRYQSPEQIRQACGERAPVPNGIYGRNLLDRDGRQSHYAACGYSKAKREEKTENAARISVKKVARGQITKIQSAAMAGLDEVRLKKEAKR